MVGIDKFLEYKYFSSGRDFDSVEWRAWSAQRTCDGDSPRLDMLDDLQNNHLRTGIRRPAVIKLLGPPSYTWSPRELEWGMGGLIDCEFLELSFNKRGKLRLVETMQG